MIDEIRNRLSELRNLYIRATPSQRFKVAVDRLRYHDSGPNQIIQHVSAVEGFVRSVAMDFERKAGTPADQAYDILRNIGPVPIITDFISKRLQADPDIMFGKDDWELFKLAVQYRNFLIHESSFLRHGYSTQLIGACKKVLYKLADLSEIKY